MNTSGSVSFQSGTYYTVPAPAGLTGANNGTSLDGTGKIVQLGSTAAPAGALLNNRIIDLTTFRLRFNRGISNMDFNGGTTQPFVNQNWSVVQNPGVPVVNIRASDHGELQFKLWQPSNTDDSSNEFLMPAGFFDDEGFSAKITFDAGNLSYVRLSSLASNDFAIGTGVNFAGAPMRFLLNDMEVMRFNDDGSGTVGIRNITDPAAGYFYLKATAAPSPALYFLNAAQANVAQIFDDGTFGAVNVLANNIISGDIAQCRLLQASTNITVNGDLQTSAPSGAAVPWLLGNRKVAASALDTTAYVEVKIAGVIRKLALIV